MGNTHGSEPAIGMEPKRTARHPSHYERARQELETLTRRLAARGDRRLPSEDQLAQLTGFSRPTIRSALHAMEFEGKVQRRQGVGTFVNRHAVSIGANLADDQPFLETLEALGYEARIEIISVTDQPLTEEQVERCGAPDGDRGVVIDRLFRASGRPAVFSRDVVPLSYLTHPLTETSAERSTFAFVRRWTGRTIRYSVTAIRPAHPPEPVAEALGLPSRQAVLVLDHQHIDERDEAVAVTHAYVRDDLVRFAVVRSGTGI